MKTWTAPKLTELDVRLTAKQPGLVERLASPGPGTWYPSTYPASNPTYGNGYHPDRYPGLAS